MLRSYFAQQVEGGARGGTGATARAGNMSALTCMREEGARGPWPSDQILIKKGAWKLAFSSSFVFFVVKFVVNSVVMLDVYSGGLSEEGK